MPLLLIGIIAVAAVVWAVDKYKGGASPSARIGGTSVDIPRPPAAYQGDDVFAIPHMQWGHCLSIARLADGGYAYGVQLRDGSTVALKEHEVVR